MSARTPGPWKLKREGVISNLAGDVIATTGYRVTAVDDEDEPNAAYIVEACNAYDTLRAENLRLRDALKEIAAIEPLGAYGDAYASAVSKAESALEGSD